MVTIQQLIDSTNTVKGYDTQNTFSKKKFGAIYAFNKVATPKPKDSIIEISMMIKGVTDMIHLKTKDRPVAAHKVLIAIKGVKQELLTRAELISRMKLKYVELREEDKEERKIEREANNKLLTELSASNKNIAESLNILKTSIDTNTSEFRQHDERAIQEFGKINEHFIKIEEHIK